MSITDNYSVKVISYISPVAFPSKSGDRGASGRWTVVTVVVVVVAFAPEEEGPPAEEAPPPEILFSGAVPTAPAAAVAFSTTCTWPSETRLNVSRTLVLYPEHL